MPQEPVSMRKIREIPRLKYECGLTNRSVGRSLLVSHTTVAEGLRRVAETGLSWSQPDTPVSRIAR